MDLSKEELGLINWLLELSVINKKDDYKRGICSKDDYNEYREKTDGLITKIARR